jgi:hypothetical protein
MSENRGDVRMNETESTQADGDQNSGFEKLEQGDHAEHPGLGTFHVTVHRRLLGRRRSLGFGEKQIPRCARDDNELSFFHKM